MKKINKKEKLINPIKEEIKCLCLTKKENLSNKEKGFILWILINYFDIKKDGEKKIH